MDFIVVFEGMVEGMLNPAGKDPDYNFLRISLYEDIKRYVIYFCAQSLTLDCVANMMRCLSTGNDYTKNYNFL